MDEGDTAVHATKTLLEDASVNYVIDAQGSTFVAQAFATGMLSAFGHDPRIAIRTFGGELSFNLTGSTVEGARLNIRIQADSLEVTDDISAKDKQEVLETDRFPEIVYECSRVSTSGSSDRCWVALNGDLTLHGVTRSVPVSARVVINGSSVRATGDFSVRQSDYEIAAVSAAGGTIKLKDEVKLTFDIVARKKE
jgi:polyisoprenoid-binding protein YceI